MKASYNLNVEQEQRRLGMSHKELNRLNVKHNNVNLLRNLMSLNVNVTEKTGFYGSFEVINQTEVGSQPRHMDAFLAFNNVALTPSQQINGDSDFTFNISEQDRLPLPASVLQLKVTFQNNTQAVNINAYDGFEPTNFTGNPLDEENTLDMLVDANNYDNGFCSVTFVVSFEP